MCVLFGGGGMGNSPAVSVMMCVYNAEQYLQQAVESILEQTFTDFELIAVDDGSTDGSLEILQAYATRDDRIMLLAEEHAGIAASRNKALKAARGELLAIADADDISLPRRIETQATFLKEHHDFVAVGCSRRLIDPDGGVICDIRAEVNPEKFKVSLMKGRNGEGCVLMMRRKTAIEAGGFANTQGAEDLDMLLSLLREGKIGNVPEILVKYRKHFQSICYTNTRLVQDINAVLERHALPQLSSKPSIFSVLPEDEQAVFRNFVSHWRWSRWALSAGNFRTSIKHAFKAVNTSIPLKALMHGAAAAMHIGNGKHQTQTHVRY